MQERNMRKVKVAFLHSGLSIPGVSNEIGVTLNPIDPQSKIKGAALWWSDEGLEVHVNDKFGKDRHVLVPATNVKSLEFFADDKFPAA